MFTEAATELIGNHQVTVLADLLVHRLQAVHQLEALLAADVVPHATLMWGKSLVDESSPTFLGIYAGAASDERVRRAIEEAPVLVTAGVEFTDMVSGFFTQHIDPTRTIDVGHNQSVVAGQFFAPLDIEAALEALTGILERRGVRSQPLPPASSDSHFEPPAREHPLTQEVLWDSLSAGADPGQRGAGRPGHVVLRHGGAYAAQRRDVHRTAAMGVDRVHAAGGARCRVSAPATAASCC